MADTITLEEMEVAAAQLSPNQRLELAERIQAQLEQTTPGVRIKYPKQTLPIDEYIALCNEVATLTPGEFDSAADLRRLRDEE